ncbi:excalibur calcium-binding domain-containing protein [Nocardia sp. NPDC050406]|uniref:excalibur calcium-binding domain-containing protein n=1 Tax=Nocardia sp. NPDC050406 TaxID=3364318 RepID=UPI0037A1508E
MNRTDLRSAGSVTTYLAGAALSVALIAFAPAASAEPGPPGKPSGPTTSKSEPYPYYVNCQQVLREGEYPLLVGEPGYRPGLDDDGNGVACD